MTPKAKHDAPTASPPETPEQFHQTIDRIAAAPEAKKADMLEVAYIAADHRAALDMLFALIPESQAQIELAGRRWSRVVNNPKREPDVLATVSTAYAKLAATPAAVFEIAKAYAEARIAEIKTRLEVVNANLACIDTRFAEIDQEAVVIIDATPNAPNHYEHRRYWIGVRRSDLEPYGAAMLTLFDERAELAKTSGLFAKDRAALLEELVSLGVDPTVPGTAESAPVRYAMKRREEAVELIHGESKS